MDAVRDVDRRVVIVVGLILALLTGVLVVGSRLVERPGPLDPIRYSGRIETMTHGGGWGSARTDVHGDVWTSAPGHLVRVDAATGEARSWTVGDDEAFASEGIAPARDGGVWVIGKTALRRFDGTAFRTVIEAPVVEPPAIGPVGEIQSLAEAPDGSLWAALGARGVRRWDGTRWATVGEGAPRVFATFLEVDERGRVLAGGIDGGVSVFDGTRWTTYPGSAGVLASEHTVRSIAVAPDGAMWVGTDFGVARLDEGRWTDLTADVTAAAGASARAGVMSVAFDAAGAAWLTFLASSESGLSEVHVARFDGKAWTAYGPADGLPGDGHGAWVTTTGDDAYVATSSGVYRLRGARWIRVYPMEVEPGMIRSLLAVSRDEAWAGTDAGVFHHLGGSWVRDQPGDLAEDVSGAALAVAPDGRLWTGGSFGLAVRGDDGWTIVAGVQNGWPLAFASDGGLWVADSHYPADQLELFWMAPGDRRVGPDPLEPSPLGWISSLAVGRDGTVWAGSNGFFAGERAGLARFDGRRWERVRPRGSFDTPVAAIAAAPNGDIWVRFDGTGSVARFDGTTWTEYGFTDGLVRLGAPFGAGIAVGPDGTVWVATQTGLARFDGERWTVRDEAIEFDQVAIAPDGTVWATGTGGILRIRVDTD